MTQMFSSIEQYNHTNQTDLSKRLITIDGELESDDIKLMKFLCADDIPSRTLEKIEEGIQIFNELEKIGKLDTLRGEVDYLLECFYRCHRLDLISKLGYNKLQVKQRFDTGMSNFSPFRILLFEIAEEMETADLKPALFSLTSVIPRSKHDRITTIFDLFTQLERIGELSPVKTDVLLKILKMLERGDLISKLRNYTGNVPNGFNTEPGYGPVDEGEPVSNVQTGLKLNNQYGNQMQIPSTHGQTRAPNHPQEPIQFTGFQLPITQINQFQANAGIFTQSNQQTIHMQGQIQDQVMDIRGQGQNRGQNQISEEVWQRLKEEDRRNDRVIPPGEMMSSGAEQEQPSLDHQTQNRNLVFQTLTGPFNRYDQTIGNPAQTGALNRTGYSIQPSANHLVPRRDEVIEEQVSGESGLTAGTISVSDQSSGGLFLSITESKLVPLAEIVAEHGDCDKLAHALGIDSAIVSNIVTSSPTMQLRIHGYMKHWFVQERERSGTSPNAGGLLDAFRTCGFEDAIKEYLRLSQEPESVAESENLQVQSEGDNFLLRSQGEIVRQIPQNDEMDVQGPAMVYSSSGAQVGPSLDPLINQNIGRPTLSRQDEAVLRQMETVAIDDSAMPFYKMDARPRGKAIIINNQHFYRIPDDPQSKELPARTGTERDAEKLDYIWRKLDFIVQHYNDVDSARMTQIMVETKFEDHSNYDCLVVCILTHGVLGHVYGTDGRYVRISTLTSCFSSRKCPSLAGKPKLFFIQACQGREKQEGQHIETDSVGSIPEPDVDNNVEPDRPRELIPDEADFLLGYATVPGYVSYRSRSQGSWYINKLAQNLDKYARVHDLLTILIKVNEEVGRATANIDNGSYKQIPAPMFTLRKRILFK